MDDRSRMVSTSVHSMGVLEARKGVGMADDDARIASLASYADSLERAGMESIEVDGSPCYVPFCREVFDTPAEVEEHRHVAHSELYE